MSTESQPPQGSLSTTIGAARNRAVTYLSKNRQNLRAAFPRLVPIVQWLPKYPRTQARTDIIAGITIWGVGIPTAMAYAGIAGVPAQAGLYSALAALTAYAIFGTSRHLKVTASSTMAVMSAAVIAPLAAGDAARYWTLTAGLALVVGILLVVAGFVRLGFIADFLSKPVVTGFVFGLAIVILVGQLPKLFGVPAGQGNVFEQLVTLLKRLGETNPYTLAVSIGAMLLITMLRRYLPLIPSGLAALGAGILVSAVFQLQTYGVSTVGAIPTGLPQFGFPSIALFDLVYLIAGAAGIVFLAVGDPLGSARAFASKHHYEIDADQELIALGMTNVATSFSQGMTVDASLSITATADSAGAKTQVAGLVMVGMVLITLLVLAPLFAPLPSAVLAAIVINAVLGLMDVQEIKRYYNGRRTDFVLALVALFGVILSDVLTGLVIAVLLSLILVLYRASRPYVAYLGRVPSQPGAYGDIKRHPEYQEIDGLLIVRLDAPLFFANANVAQKEMRATIDARESALKALLLDLGATADLDFGGSDMLMEFIGDLRNQDIDVMLAQVRGSVRDSMRKTGLMEVVGEDRVFFSVDAAVHNYLSRFGKLKSSGQAV